MALTCDFGVAQGPVAADGFQQVSIKKCRICQGLAQTQGMTPVMGQGSGEGMSKRALTFACQELCPACK